MKSGRILVAMMMLVTLAACTAGAAPIKVKVLKNNVNLRAKEVADAEVVGQVSANDILSSKSMNNTWVEIIPPTNVSFWVLGDFIKGDVIHSRQKVNVRSGPGINFAIVGQLAAGSAVTPRGARQDWIKIAPPAVCSLWVSRSLVQVVVDSPVKPKPVKAKPRKVAPAKVDPAIKAPAKAPPVKKRDEKPATAAERKTATEQSKPAPSAQAATETAIKPPADLKLAPSAVQGAWKQYDGILRPRGVFARTPSRYRLVSYDKDGDSKTVCYVKGNNDQLSTLINRPMIISGREYWVYKQNYPVLVPDRIVLK